MRRTRIRTLLLVVLFVALTLGGLREVKRRRDLAVRREYIRALDAARQAELSREAVSRRGP